MMFDCFALADLSWDLLAHPNRDRLQVMIHSNPFLKQCGKERVVGRQFFNRIIEQLYLLRFELIAITKMNENRKHKNILASLLKLRNILTEIIE